MAASTSRWTVSRRFFRSGDCHFDCQSPAALVGSGETATNTNSFALSTLGRQAIGKPMGLGVLIPSPRAAEEKGSSCGWRVDYNRLRLEFAESLLNFISKRVISN